MTEPDTAEERMLAAVRQFLRESVPELRNPDAVSLDNRLDSELGLDSLARAELLVVVERTFGVQLPEDLFSEAETLGDLLDHALRTQGGGDTSAAAARRPAEPAAQQQERFTVPEFSTLQQALRWHTGTHPERVYLHLVTGIGEYEPLTYRQLDMGARRVGHGLLRHNLAQRETVALMLPTSLEYFYSFFGVLYAGGIPVPLYPPARPSRIEEHLRRQAAILNNAQATVMITVPEARQLAALIKAMVPTLRHVVVVEDLWTDPLEGPVREEDGNDIAFLQYTSGSTGEPKGVTLTHYNLFSNLRSMNEVLQVDQDDVFVSWLPLYHDMGLIGTCLSTLYYGMNLVVMSPLLFLTRPLTWFWAISHFRGTNAPSPNFGYEMLLKRIRDEDMEGIDLSSWRIAYNGAETVSPDTIVRFTERFRRWGFRHGAMSPVYGLAECCVGLSFPQPPESEPVIDQVDRQHFATTGEVRPATEDDPSPLRFVACGKVIPRHEVRVLDSQGRELPEGMEGVLQFRGPSATSGYFRNPEATARLFDGDWLNTGDRAYLRNGEIYITGRSKDLIVRAGRNIYPTEIEDAVGELEGVRAGCVAAFATGQGDGSGERLVVVAETREEDPEKRQALRERIQARVLEDLDISVDEVMLAASGAIPKTSSGKLRRGEARQRYERRELDRAPPAVWRQVLRMGLRVPGSYARRGLSWLGRSLYAVWVWLLFGVLGAAVFLLVNILPGLHLRWAVARTGARLLALLSATRLKVRGREYLRKLPPGCVVVANHASYLDSLVLAAALPFPVRFVAKKELTDYLLLRRFIHLMDIEVVDRTDVQQGVLDSQRLAERSEGKRLVFFAEGTFDAAPGLRPFRMGAFMTAVARQVPVLPVGLRGTRAKLPSGRWNPRPGSVEVRMGEALYPEGDDWNAAIELRRQARQAVLERSGEFDRIQS